jgi:hypothetical protein
MYLMECRTFDALQHKHAMAGSRVFQLK